LANAGRSSKLVQLADLLEALETHHGQLLASDLIDHCVPENAVTALSKFCRISPQAVRDMDLRRRAPYLDAVQLMRYEGGPMSRCPRLRLRRVRYAFCPLCLVKQQVIHTRWIGALLASLFATFIELRCLTSALHAARLTR
jgi:hypothetical protein